MAARAMAAATAGPGRRGRQRRGKGEGSITRLADGRWQGRIDLGWVHGKRQRKAFYGKTRKEVQQQLARALADLQRGQPPVPERETVGSFLLRWLEDVARPSVRPLTYRSYRDLVRLHLVPELGKLPLARLAPRDVQALLGRKLEAGLSPRRVQYLRAVLRRALNQALRWGLVARNVATLVAPPRVHSPPVAPLGPEEARRLLDAVHGDRLEALYVTTLLLGLRQGEALGLRWPDVDLEAGLVRIAVTLQRLDGAYRLVEPKTARSRRTLRLPRLVGETLRAHRARQLAERLAAGPAWRNDWELVFTTERGAPLHASTVTHHFQRLLRRAGLAPRRFHDLRHGCATLLLAQGVPARQIMEILGHSQISLTLNTYAHVLPSMLQDAADRLDALFPFPPAPPAPARAGLPQIGPSTIPDR